jgi:Flp pilus assembly protein TadG
MTGQAQTQSMTAQQFKQAVCTNAQSMFSCANIAVNVQTFSTFTAITAPVPLQNGQLDTKNLSFNPGTPGSIELVQVFYPWPVITGLPGLNMSSNGGTRILQATAVFRNEPY